MDLKEYALLCAKTGAKLPYVISKRKYKTGHDFIRNLGRHCLENYWIFQKVISPKVMRKESIQQKMLEMSGANLSKETEDSLMRGYKRFSENYQKKKSKVAANLVADFGEIQAALAYTFGDNGELAEQLLTVRYLKNPDDLLSCKEAEKATHISHTLYYKTINQAIDDFADSLFGKGEADARIAEIPDAIKVYDDNV